MVFSPNCIIEHTGNRELTHVGREGGREGGRKEGRKEGRKGGREEGIMGRCKQKEEETDRQRGH